MRYPSELETTEFIAGIGDAFLRPVRFDDGPAIDRFFDRLSPDDVRTRFFSPLQHLPPRHVERLTHLDYDRDMALLLTECASGEILGVVRLSAHPDAAHLEFAITVRSDLKGQGIGDLLTTRMLAYARRHGAVEIHGEILAENRPSLNLARKFGFHLARAADSPSIVHATLLV